MNYYKNTKDNELLQKYMEIWEKVKNSLIEEFNSKPIYNEKLKENLITEKPTQIYTTIKYQNKVLNIFVYQLFYSILFLERVKTIILECFSGNVNMLLKTKDKSILIIMQKFFLILMKKLRC